jgi:hypothetical protein
MLGISIKVAKYTPNMFPIVEIALTIPTDEPTLLMEAIILMINGGTMLSKIIGTAKSSRVERIEPQSRPSFTV